MKLYIADECPDNMQGPWLFFKMSKPIGGYKTDILNVDDALGDGWMTWNWDMIKNVKGLKEL